MIFQAASLYAAAPPFLLAALTGDSCENLLSDEANICPWARIFARHFLRAFPAADLCEYNAGSALKVPAPFRGEEFMCKNQYFGAARKS
jgi:hypothetical protein